MIIGKLLNKPLQFVFIIACLIALAYPAINIFIVFPSFKNLLVRDAEDIAGQIARHFSREAVSFNNLKDTPDFAEEAKRFEEEYKLEQMKVYSETGVIVYSSTPGEIGKINQDAYFREIVAKGNNYSKLVKKDSKTFEGRVVDADVVEAYVPVIEEGRFVGAVEVYYDITLKNQAIVKKVFLYSIIPFSLMFILLIVVAVVLLKAEKTAVELQTGEMYINYLSPLYLLLITTIAIFSVESIVMLFLSVFPPISPVGVALLDSSLLIMIIAPVLYFSLLRPLKKHIAERRRMEEVVRRSEEKYRSLVESTDDSIYLVDRNYKYLFINRKHLSRMGLSEEEGIDRSYHDLHSPEEIDSFVEKVDKVFEMGQAVQQEHISQRDRRYFLRTMSPLKGSEDETVAVNVISKDITEIKRFEEKLKELSRHLEAVREEERTNIAREVHDELGQALTALKMDASWLNKKLPRGEELLIEKTKAMTKTIGNIIQSVKKISSKLRPSVLDHFGLAAAIEGEAIELKERTGIDCKVTVEPEDIRLDKEHSTAIFRIFQEALTNITRHAEATTVNVSLELDSNRVTLTVKDNGKGITEDQLSKPESFGLMGIQERADSLRGKVKISGTPGKGTQVKVVIPLDGKEKGNAENTHSR
ncbi:MAG: PAS domain S-box protein [Nitrospiraceae bacterium]|nr:MAG: PAS domain S-box protein [Nitrospiraceae bacterium]